MYGTHQQSLKYICVFDDIHFTCFWKTYVPPPKYILNMSILEGDSQGLL